MAMGPFSAGSSMTVPPSEDTPSKIFQDIKFFIQKDLAQQIQTDLYNTITTLGGRVENKVPRNGYVLVSPGSAEAERLRQCWRSHERPERYFVPHTYVEACKLAGALIKQIFLVNGEPMKIHIHPSIKNINTKVTISERILHSGGDPTSSAQSATVILADPNTEVFQQLCKTYSTSTEKYIESWQWTKNVVDLGEIKFTPLTWKNPGGRRAGEERIHFTKEDEDNLCHWIATKIPYKSVGGRTGNKLYQQLCDLSDDPAYAWVTRHTWQSWRERYKKNAPRLDTIIASIVEKNNIQHGEKGQHNFVREPQPEESASGPSKKKRLRSSSESVPVHAASAPVGGKIMVMNADDPVPQPLIPGLSAPPVLVDQVLVDGQLLPISHGQHQHMEDESEWGIRVGNEPPPTWAVARKRPLPAIEDSSECAPKRARTNVSEIARTSRFTTAEVEEWLARYDGDLERTARRFREMRRLADSLSDDF